MSTQAVINFAITINYVDVRVSPLHSICSIYFVLCDWKATAYFFQYSEDELKLY